MKFLIDLFAAQADSKSRGAGRYVLPLIRAMAGLRGANEMTVLADALYPQSFETLRQEFIRLLAPAHFLPYFHEPVRFDLLQRTRSARSAEALVIQAYLALAPQIVLTPDPFAGWMEKGVVPAPQHMAVPFMRAAIVYDFVPYDFHEEYLKTNLTYRAWYTDQLHNLRGYDLLLTMSEAVRWEAVNRLGIDPQRIVNIGGDTIIDSVEVDWENVARTALQAMESMQKEKKQGVFNQPPLRIAYVSPIPPQKSGISIYSAVLLRYLKKYFEIDLFVQDDVEIQRPALGEKFDMYTWGELPARRDTYAAVVYQIGNSQFHHHMLDLLKEIRGVVVQHDFFLNNIPFVEEAWFGRKGAFLQAMNNSHGLRGMIETIKYGMETARLKWPINWEVMKYAQELIVHSEHQNELTQLFYARGWMPDPTIIHALRAAASAVSPSVKKDIREELGLDAEAFIFCSFGFLAPTKLNLLTLRAFSALRLALPRNVLLVFVGELGHGEYEQQVLELIENLNLKEQVKITGFVSQEQYDTYLLAADAALQLRADSRGETSAAILDCMSHGLALILNSHGTSNDYNAADVIKLPDPPSVEDVTQAMIRLTSDEALRMQVGQNAKKYIADQHDPEKAAAAYAEVIHRAIEMNERKLFAPILKQVANRQIDKFTLQAATKYAAANVSLRSQPRILLDVTDIARKDWGGGIQRVVRNLVQELLTTADLSIHIELVHLEQGQVVCAYRFAELFFDLPPQSLGLETPVDIQVGDTLFMLDSTWADYNQFLPVFERVRKSGGKIVTLVHDLIPIRFQHTCAQVVLDVFELWLNSAIRQSDSLICVSKVVADDLAAYLSEKQISLSHSLDVSYIRLGAERTPSDLSSKINELVSIVADNKESSLYLMVGTLEPRKGHAFVLDAFEKLWQAGHEHRLCLVGRVGWNVAEVEARVRDHPRLNKNLFFIESPTDTELNILYSAATALVTASLAEGFGLPIVEAALHHVPVLASDIPVFREVGGDGAMYFSLDSSDRLVDAVIAMDALDEQERIQMAERIQVYSWKEYAEAVLEALKGRNVYQSLSRPLA